MDRRSAIAAFVGRKNVDKSSVNNKSALVSSLAPFSGQWTFAAAAHLLRRTTFGPTNAQINQAVLEGLDATIGQLLTIKELPSPPINFNFPDDPTTPIGESWIDKPNDPNIQNLNTSRNISLNAWQIGVINEESINIREKLVLFWHNHFVTSAIVRSGNNYDYLNTLRRNALGNFRTLTEEMTISSSMLLYLNGNENTRQAPNENFSRELLELFTIGKGDPVGAGDYTNYTEDDVVQLAKALTGWRSTNVDGIVGSIFINSRHDTSDKPLSHRFDNVVITNENEQEYKTVIDVILQQEETARHLARRLHIWFVGSDIDADTEINVIEPLAALIRDNNYEIRPALNALLKSEYFYQESIRGCMINHPIDFIFKLFNTFEIKLPDTLLAKYRVWINIFRNTQSLDMEILAIPSVAGWKAFYQGPQYYDAWANSVSLPIRENIVDSLLNGINIAQERIGLDVLSVVNKLENANDPIVLIDTLADTIFPFSISQSQKDFLKEVLIPGLPEFEWTVEYGEYLEDQDNPDKRDGVETKLNALFEAMLKMPEFYLI